jgi:hypothetical protein
MKKDGTITFEEMCQVVAGMEKSKKVLFFFNRHHHLGGNVPRGRWHGTEQQDTLLHTLSCTLLLMLC